MLGRYRIDEILGQGVSGIVYHAFDTTIERPVAIKCLQTGPAESATRRMSLLFQEAKVIGQLSHPHIAAVFDMGSSDGVSYIVMEYVQGETLKPRLAQADKASVPQILSFIVMVCRALHYVHQRGILHGDIKPANIMVTPQGTPKIMDFGVARRSHVDKPATWSLAGEKSVWGTPGYIAPEQFTKSEIDARADVFSLGVIAYEWLAGRKPFRSDTADEFVKAVSQGPVKSLCDRGEFDAELSWAIDQALASDPARRCSSADALADALEICLERWLKQFPPGYPPTPLDSNQNQAFPRLKGRNILFADFNEEELAGVMRMSRRETFSAGDTIFQEGAGGSTMYVVVDGRVSIRKMSGDSAVEIKQVSRGECFGEMAVISQTPRSATVVALRSTEVIAISGAVLRSASQVLCMKLYRNIAALLSERVRLKDAQIMTQLQTDREETSKKRSFLFW